MVEKLFPESFLKNQNSAYLWISSLKFVCLFVFTVCQVEENQNTLKLRRGSLAFTSYNSYKTF